jgi:hypothetical protein
MVMAQCVYELVVSTKNKLSRMDVNEKTPHGSPPTQAIAEVLKKDELNFSYVSVNHESDLID